MGRPLKLTPETAEKILGLVRLGNYRETAYAAAGVCRHTVRVWLQRASKGEEPFASFAKKLDEAEAGGEARHVATLFTAAKEDWRAAAWFLSRKHHGRWGDKVQIEIQERLGDILDVVSDVLGAEAASRVFAEVARRSGAVETPQPDSEGGSPTPAEPIH